MNAYVVLAVVGGVLGILPIVWKSKGVYVFFMLCAGNLLSSGLSGPLSNQIREVVRSDGVPLQAIVRGTLLLLPALLAVLLSRKSVKKKRAPFHFFASLAAGILGYLWFIRVLPFEQFSLLENADITKQLMLVRDAALGVGMVSGLALLWAERPKPEEEHKGKHKK